MLAHIPEKIRLIFGDVNGSSQRLIVFLVFRSTLKNDFTIGPLVTGMDGDIIITRDFVDKEIAINKNEFPMDYSGGLVDCDLLTVIVESRSDLEERIKRLMKYYPDDANMLQELLADSANRKLSLHKDIRLPTAEGVISIELD